ncbi:MAG: hypothetical protein OHK0026_15820 [Rhodocyclaceae bacterium]
MSKRKIVLAAGLALVSAPAAYAVDGKEVYDRVCYKCHRNGVDEAPKAGDKAAWEKRIAQGRAALIKSVTEGKGNMDPRAGKDLSDEEIAAGVDYITSLVK